MSKSLSDLKIFINSKILSRPIWIIFFVALLLRVFGDTHGFPYILHPDEPAVIREALGIRFSINPHHFDWPHLFLYMNYFVYMGFAYMRDLMVTLNLKSIIEVMFPLVWDDNLIFYLISRVFAGFLGALTIFPVYLSAKNLFGNKIGLFSALVFAVIPFHVRHSHYALIDVPMTFFLAWGMYFTTHILKREKASDYAFGGLFVGLSASTKYNGGLSAIMIPISHMIRVVTKRENFVTVNAIKNLAISGILAVFGFLLGTPFAMFDFDTFKRTDGPKGALWQFTNVGKVSPQNQLSQFFDANVNKLSDDFGFTILIGFWLVVTYLIVSAVKRRFDADFASLLYLVIMSVFFLYYVSGFIKYRSHYYMPSYPYLAIVAGFFAEKCSHWLQNKKKWLGALFLGIFFALPLYLSVQQVWDLQNRVVLEEDTKIYAGEYERR